MQEAFLGWQISRPQQDAPLLHPHACCSDPSFFSQSTMDYYSQMNAQETATRTLAYVVCIFCSVVSRCPTFFYTLLHGDKHRLHAAPGGRMSANLRGYSLSIAQKWTDSKHSSQRCRDGEEGCGRQAWPAKGGGLFEFQTPPPPKFLNLSFSNLRFCEKVLAPKVPIFFDLLRGYFFYPMCLHAKYQEFCGEIQNGRKTQKKIPPD